MNTAKSGLDTRKKVVERRNNIVTLVALVIWLALSFVGQMLFIDQNERLDTGAIFVTGAGPILLISAINLLFYRIANLWLLIRSIAGIVLIGTGVGELTDASKGVIWGAVGICVLVVIVVAIIWRVLRRRSQ